MAFHNRKGSATRSSFNNKNHTRSSTAFLRSTTTTSTIRNTLAGFVLGSASTASVAIYYYYYYNYGRNDDNTSSSTSTSSLTTMIPSSSSSSSSLPTIEPTNNGNNSQTLQYHSASTYGIPNNMRLLVRDSYIVAYDYRTRNPLWTLQHLTPTASKSNNTKTTTTDDSSSSNNKNLFEQLLDYIDDTDDDSSTSSSKSRRSQFNFKQDAEIPIQFRTKPNDYKHSGYDRGHLVPAADAARYAANVDITTSIDETFLLSNISPQVGKGFNRSYWNRLEQFCRNLAKLYTTSHDVYVISGPLYLPKKDGSKHITYPVIYTNGSNNGGSDDTSSNNQMISVPTHFFKSILVVTKKKKNYNTDQHNNPQYMIANFILPNQNISRKTPLEDFSVSLDELQCKSGLLLWTKLLQEDHHRYDGKSNNNNNLHNRTISYLCNDQRSLCTLPGEEFWNQKQQKRGRTNK